MASGVLGVHGGARFGAGRKRGSGMTRYAVKSAMAVADKIGLLPIEVLMHQLQYTHRRAVEAQREFDKIEAEVKTDLKNGVIEEVKVKLLEKRFDQMRVWFNAAHERATSAAPYLHPRISAVQISGDQDNPLQAEHTVRIIADALDATARAKLIDVAPLATGRG